MKSAEGGGVYGSIFIIAVGGLYPGRGETVDSVN